jgi:hypothetical protein
MAKVDQYLVLGTDIEQLNSHRGFYREELAYCLISAAII